MKRRDDYPDFQERMFQEIQWEQDLEAQLARKTERNRALVFSTGKALGLSEMEVLALLRLTVQKGLDGPSLAHLIGSAAELKRQQPLT